MQQHHQTSGCTTNIITHLRRYHPQLLSSGSMQAKSTPKPPSTDQAAASTASGVTQPASQQQRQQTLWNQTHQLEQTVSADSVESDTSAGTDCVSRHCGARNINYTTSATGCEPCSRRNPRGICESGSVARGRESHKNTNVPAGHSSDTWSSPRARVSWPLKKWNGSEKNHISRWKTILWFGGRWTCLAFSYWEDRHRCTWPFPPQVSPLNESSRQQETLWPPRGPTWSRSKLINWSSWKRIWSNWHAMVSWLTCFGSKLGL